MVRRILAVVSLIVVAESCALAEISSTGEHHTSRLLGPADQTRPAWAPVRPLLGNRDFTPLLDRLLKSDDASECARAAFLLGMLAERDFADRIASLLRHPQRSVRVSAGLGLGFLGDERGIHVCETVLKSDPDWMRYYAVYALWYMNTPRATAVLKRNSSTGIPMVDKAIRDALKTRHAVPTGQWQPPLEEGYEPTADELWALVVDVFIAESDQWWHRGDFSQTIRCQEAALFFDPTYTEGYSLIAWLQWSGGDDAAAIKTLRRGIDAVPDSPDTWGALGQHYTTTKRCELALEPLRKGVELGGDHLIRRPYAHCLEKLGKLEECLAQWEAIVKECPDDPAAPLNAERLRKKIAEQG